MPECPNVILFCSSDRKLPGLFKCLEHIMPECENYELRKIWIETAIDYLNFLHQNMSGVTEKMYEKSVKTIDGLAAKTASSFPYKEQY
jgi:hypothetical protein